MIDATIWVMFSRSRLRRPQEEISCLRTFRRPTHAVFNGS